MIQSLIKMGAAGLLLFLFHDMHSQTLFETVKLSEWEQEGRGKWEVTITKGEESLKGPTPRSHLRWVPEEKGASGILRSNPFTIQQAVQLFDYAGMYGKNADGGPAYNRIRLVAHPGGEILRETITNNYSSLSPGKWYTPGLTGREVRLEIFAPPVYSNQDDQLVGLAFENYRQEASSFSGNPQKVPFQAVKIDEPATTVFCRSIPFRAVNPALRTGTSRTWQENREIIPVGARAEKLFLLGMINAGWENGVAHWGEHPEMRVRRTDQNYIGNRIGCLHIRYEQGPPDTIPLIVGTTVWFSNHWSHGASHDVSVPCQEPFASRPELMEILRSSLKVQEDTHPASFASDYQHYYLVVKPRNEKMESLVIEDDPGTRGRPLVSGISLTGEPQEGLYDFGRVKVSPGDLETGYDVNRPPDLTGDAEKLEAVLYTRPEDLPSDPELLEMPAELDATAIRFIGDKEADWLSNVWTANLVQINDKFDPETGYFRETGADCPWYGGYSGIGTWNIQGVYPAAYSRTSDHYVTLALRHIDLPARETAFVDFCDYHLYFYRNNHDPEKGPPNELLDLSQYPAGAPPHWSMELNMPPTGGGWLQVNEIYGDEEMDGHAATIIGRWVAWRLQGGTGDAWLTSPRETVFGKSRWESTADAAEFICWLMDYTGRDLVYSEGEFTGWGGIAHNFCLVPEGMRTETDPQKIRENYANANMYEPYPNFACMTALQCAAEMADSTGNQAKAKKWKSYAEKIRKGMLRQLISGDYNELKWRISPYSILTTFQDRLVQTFFSLYGEGLDPALWDSQMQEITRNTFREHMDKPYGHQPVLAMGYGQGWLTHAALLLDEMDDAGPLLVNAAKYTYDKNMNYVNREKGIDWRKWMWIVPEGVNILPGGSWHRINDLSNGANQGPVMHAIEACAGVDDILPGPVKILPRVPEPLKGIEVKNHAVLIRENGQRVKAKVDFQYEKGKFFALQSDKTIPELEVRLGPWDSPARCTEVIDRLKKQGFEAEMAVSGSYQGKKAHWVWVRKEKNIQNLRIEL